MKRILLTISVIVSLATVLLFLSPLFLKMSGLDASIKKYILPKIVDTTQVNLDINDFSVGLGTIEFSNVTINLPQKSFKSLIKSIRFDFELYRLFLHPTKPEKALKSIRLVKPRFIYSVDPSVPKTAVGSKTIAVGKFLRMLKKIPSIHSLQIEDGRIIYRNHYGQFLSLAQNLKGRLNTDSSKTLQMDLSGSLFSTDEENFYLSAVYNLQNQVFDSRLKLTTYHIKNSLLPYFTDWARLNNGLLDGEIRFRFSVKDSSKNRLSAEIHFKNLAGILKDRAFSQTHFTLSVSGKQLTVPNGQGIFLQEPFSFSAQIENIYRPNLKARFKIGNVPFKNISVAFAHNNFLKNGRLPLSGLLLADFKNNRYAVRLNSSGFRSRGKFVIKNIYASFYLQKKHFTADAINFITASGMQVSGKGVFFPDQHRFNMELSGFSRMENHSILDRLNGKKQTINIVLSADTQSLHTRGHWRYLLAEPADTLLSLSGAILGNGNRFSIQLGKSNIPELKFLMQVKNLMSAPIIQKAELLDFPFYNFSSNQLLTKNLKKISTRIELQGKPDRLKGFVELREKDHPQNRFRLNTNIERLYAASRRIRGSFQLKDLYGFYDLNITPSELAATINCPAGLFGRLHLDMAKNGLLEGKFHLKDLNIRPLLSDSLLSGKLRMLGQLNGNLELSNTIYDPVLKAKLQGDKFVFNKVGYYQAQLSVLARKSKIVLDTLSVSLNNLPLMDGNIMITYPGAKIQGNLSGDQIDVEKIISTVFPGYTFLNGMGNFVLTIGGTLRSPRIVSSVDIRNGRLDKIPFDQISLRLLDKVRKKGRVYRLGDHRLIVNNFTFLRTGQLNLQASGKLPLSTKDSLEMSIDFNGDILHLLPHWAPFFLNGTSNSEINLQLTGTAGRVKIKSGFCRIERGELWMKSVAPHVRNISGLIQKKPGGNQVDFINLKGTVDGRTLTMNTVRHVKTAGRGFLKPWYFKGLNLDFGVIKMETSPKGIELNIPGLMEKEDFGDLYLSGKNKNEAFYFAGPVRHPVAYGNITLFNARLTYPFIVSKIKRNKRNPTVEFLSNMDWDIHMNSAEDVVYHRDIPAYIDNVNAEIFIDESSPGLSFKGIISKHTFHVLGKLTSSRGSLDYLDQNFRVDHFAVEFSAGRPYPLISGRAWTTIRDSIGAVPKTIYLKLYGLEQGTRTETQQVNLENLRFKLESADPQINESQEQVLAQMGFSVANIKNKVTSVGGAITDRYLIRPLLRPIERVLQKSLGVDMVKINSNIAKNLFYSSLGGPASNNLFFNPYEAKLPYLYLMQSSEFTIGKYLSQDLFLTYTGQLVSVYNHNQSEFNLNHSLGLEYRFLRNVLLEFEYDRESLGYFRLPTKKQYIEDFKIRLRHSFTF